MDSEIHNFVKIWSNAAASLIYCHQIAARIPAGAARLLSLLPVIYLFTTLPLSLSSFHLAAPTVFYLLWLGNFKLLLFAFAKGPLSAPPPPSLFHFVAIGFLPIATKKTLAPKTDNSLIQFLLKSVLLAVIVISYGYRASIHPCLILPLYCCHVYLGVELLLAATAAPVRAALGLDLEPQFNEPYLATSLQDFWGKRWNLMVPGILRPTVYLPVRRISARVLGRRSAALVSAVLATFVVSGLMHEVIYYCLTRVSPTWEVTWFFVLHGICVVAEIGVKKTLTDWCRLPPAVSCPMTVGFVAVTGWWLFFPQVIRNGLDLKAIDEYGILVRFVSGGTQRLNDWIRLAVYGT